MPSKLALITGASKGIGRAVAGALAGEDVELLLNGRSAPDLNSLAAEIGQQGGACLAITGDLREAQTIEHLVDAIRSRQNRLDLLVHSAGVAHVGKVAEMSREAWQENLDINLTVPFYLTRRCLPFMSKGAQILFINSIAGRSPFPEWSAYCAAKAGLAAFADALRQEVAGSGIKVISLFPASVDTPMQDKLPYRWDRSRMLTAGQVAEIVRFCYRQPEQVLLKNIDAENISGAF